MKYPSTTPSSSLGVRSGCSQKVIVTSSALIFLSELLENTPHAIVQHYTIVIHPHVHATIIDDLTPHALHFINYHIAAHAQVNIVQRHHAPHTHSILGVHLYVAEHAHVYYNVILRGEQRAQLFFTTHSVGMYATSTVIIAAALTGNAHVKLTTRQEHTAGQSTSAMYVRGVLYDRAHLSYTSMIAIARRAHQTEAQQHHKVILASKHARAVAHPGLEVLANNVRCTHGSAIGSFDQQHLFFLAARGCDRVTQEKLLLDAFFGTML